MFKEQIAQHDKRKVPSIQTKNCTFSKKKNQRLQIFECMTRKR